MVKASRELYHVDPKLIIIPEDRQRKMELDISDLIPTIRARGILLPLLLTPDLTLRAGWRRYKTALFLNMAEVPYRLIEGDFDEIDIQIIEHEENAKRKDLTWQDNARALLKIHKLYIEKNGETWQAEQTAAAMGYDDKHLWRMLDLGEAIEEGDESVIKADTIANATTILTRRRQRASDEAIQRILSDGGAKQPSARTGVHDPARTSARGSINADDIANSAGDEHSPSEYAVGGVDSVDSDAGPELPPPFAIQHANALQWLGEYSGPRFNFLHADLPYGVKLGEQANQDSFEGGGYDSDEKIYWELTNALLDNWERFMYPSAHIMFWFAFKFREETMELFEKKLAHLDLRINPIPLIWHKTDNRGILADPSRGPRNIGEYAFLMSTGDRKIVKPKSNIYGAPTGKSESIHTNEKPEPMLKHFFEMLVDGHSRVFDPTAGSGSAIRASEALGAEAALGLEFNPEFAERAQFKLQQARGLRNLSSLVKEEVKAAELDSSEEA